MILTQGRKPMVANGTAEAALQAVTDAIDSLASSTPVGIQSIGITLCSRVQARIRKTGVCS